MSESRRSAAGTLLFAAALAATLLTVVSGQQPAASGPANVVIERTALELRSPETYHVAMRLEPVTSIRLLARIDGVIESVPVEAGEEVSARQEVVRLESGIRQIELERAQAAFQLAKLERDAAGEGSAAELAAARLEVATLDLRLAEQRLEDTIVRAPFDGTMTEVHVTEGEFVRAGDPLATVADVTRLAVEVPVSRNDVKSGDAIEIRVEETTVRGDVARIFPLREEFEPLRDLFLSIATARVIVDGASLSVGQAVDSEMIPRQPVVEVPTAALLNTDDGQRKVQVVREEQVRDVIVQLHGQNGEEHIFVSGRFEPQDELIVESSQELLEGARIVPSAATGFNQDARPRSTQIADDD